MLACELARLNIATVVLEQATAPSEVPKGNGLIGAIVPILAKRGLLRGEKGLHAIPMFRTPFGPLQLRLNPLRRRSALKILPVPQRRLEGILERWALAAGATILRGHTVTDFTGTNGYTDDGGHLAVTVATPNGGSETITADFLIGCDGAHSLVRHRLGIEFPGTTSPQLTRLGRVTIPAAAARRNKRELILANGTIIELFTPNRTATGSATIAPASDLDRNAPKDLYIVATQEPRGSAEPSDPISLAELQASIRRVLGFELPITEGRWLRSTVGNSRLAERFRVGRVFLAGDAAHVFSAGGSALNSGMLDAVDLAPRLAAVLRGAAEVESLEEYHRLRHAAGWETILQTRAQNALNASGEHAEALREVLTAAFGSRNPHAYLASLLKGR